MGRQTVKLTHISKLPKDENREKTYGDDDFWNNRTQKWKEKQRIMVTEKCLL